MKETVKKRKRILGYLYSLGLLGMLSILIVIGITRQGQEQKESEKTYQDISASWTLDQEGTQPVNVKKLGEYMDEESGVLSIYYQLPKMEADISLVYRSKDVYTRVLVEDEVIYETSVYESELYNRSPGNLWNILTVNSKYSQKSLEIQVFMVYDTDAITVDSLLFGDKADIILGLFADNMFGIVVSLLLILLGVVLIVVDFLPSYGRSKKHHGLSWIGIFALLTGVWSLIETNVVQFCVDDMRILQLLDNMIITLDTMPLLFYLNSEYKIFKNKWMRLLGYIGVAYMLLCVLVQYSRIKDLHHMLNGALLIMVITDFSLCAWLVNLFFKLRKAKKPVLNCFLQIVGICSLCFSSIFETIRSTHVDRMDRAGLLRVGMLMLCVCFAIGSQIETYKIVEQGLKYDLISKLAYSDGLTGLGNRTAYLEQLDAYGNDDNHSMQLGIVYLDVNNLKIVNDSQGHEYGDDLIRVAAKIIENSFGHWGKSYRIGGDEFCVLMTGTNLHEKYQKGLHIFQQLVAEVNETEGYTYHVEIAHGFAVCERLEREKIDEAIASADSEMYRNKMELKNIYRL